MKNYSEYVIGYSDHTIGIATPLAAVAKGAKIIEKHISLDRQMKGTDQAGSLAVDGISRMMRDIRNLEKSFGKEELFIDPSVDLAREKLERSLASVRRIEEGQIITEDDLHLLSPGDGFKWRDRDQVIGKNALRSFDADEIIYSKDVE